MKSNIALQISLHYSNHCATIHDSFPMNKQCHRPYHESASNRGCARTNRRPRVDYTHFKIHLLEREILRDLHNEGRISISYTKVYPFRFIGGGGDFVREEEQNSARILIGTLETSGNSPGIDCIGSLYSNYGEGGRKPIDPATSGYRHEIVSADRTSCLVAEEDRLHRECYWCASPPPPRMRLSVGCWFGGNYGWDTWI